MGYGIYNKYINSTPSLGPSLSARTDPALRAYCGLNTAFPASLGGRATALWANDLAYPVMGPVSNPGLVQATAHAVMNPDGTISFIQVDNPGKGYNYLFPPLVIIAAPPAGITILAHITITAGGILDQYIIDNIGFGYFGVAPVPTVDPPPGPGVNIVVGVFIANGRVSGQFAVDPGAGYAPPPAAGPAITFPPPPAGTQEVITGVGVDAFGQISGIAIAGVGTGYDPLNPPSVIIAPPF